MMNNSKAAKKPKSAFSRMEISNRIFYAVMLIFPIAQFLVFYIGVNINSITLAFREYQFDAGGAYTFAGLKNFRNLFRNLSTMSYAPTLLKNSLILYFCGLCVGVPLALFFSYYIYKKSPGSKIFKVILFLPSIISSIVMVIIFRYFAERAVPELVKIIFGKEIFGLLENSETIFGTLVFYNLFINFGGNVLLYTGAMAAIDESCVEAAKLDGAGYFREFFFITIPQIFPTIATFLVVGMAAIFVNEMNLYAFFGPNAESMVSTVGYMLFRDTLSGTVSNYPYLSAFGLLLTVISLPLVIGVKLGLDRVSRAILE